MQQVKEKIQELLRESAQIDDKVVLMNWYESGSTPVITPTGSFPTTVTGTHKFLHKLFVPKAGKETTIYPQVRIGHDVDFNTLREELSSWLTSYGHGIFYNMLQEEDGTDIGWLLYSTREMDAGALADELTEMIGINVGLRFKGINTGTRTVNQQNLVRALVVEASSKKKWEVQGALLKLYSRQMRDPNTYPNGIRLRFVKMKKAGVNMVEKSKMEKLRQRQKDFLQAVTSHNTDEIIQLDYSPKRGVPTLRQMIMGLNSRVTGFPLFHCVDMDWKCEGFVFQFSSTQAEEAEMTILTLLPLLEHFYPTAEVRSNFTTSAAQRCEHMIWDGDKEMIVDTSTEEETADITEEEDLMGFEFAAAVEEELQRPTYRFGPNDEDSVSTLASIDAASRYTKNRKKQSTAGSQSHTTTTSHNRVSSSSRTTQDDLSLHSLDTMVTMESINVLEGQIQGLTSQLLAEKERNCQQFEMIMKALGNLHNAHQQNDQSKGGSASNSPGDANNSSGQGS